MCTSFSTLSNPDPRAHNNSFSGWIGRQFSKGEVAQQRQAAAAKRRSTFLANAQLNPMTKDYGS